MDETVKDLAANTPTTSSSSSSTSRAPPKPQLLDLFDITPVADSLCSVLSIAEIINLTRTSKRLSTLYKNLILSQWNVNRLLGRFVDKPREFRSQMAECDAVVSGSQALQFFERVHWKEADLDVFIRMGSGVDKFCEYLMETEGYKHVSTRTDDGKVDYDTLDLVLTQTFTRNMASAPRETKIQVISTENLPVQAVLRGFYTSAIVNFLTWNKAYSLFPLPTFVYHKTYLFKGLDEYHAGLMGKYRRRGWLVQPTLWEEEKNSSCPLLGERRVGDRFSWKIAFNTNGVRKSQVPNEALEYCAFSLRESSDFFPEPPEHYRVEADLFVSKVLKHQYTYSSSNLMCFYGERTDRLTQMELLMLPLEHRPGNFLELLAKYGSLWLRSSLGFTRPPSWRYYDDQIPAWYQAYVEQQEEGVM